MKLPKKLLLVLTSLFVSFSINSVNASYCASGTQYVSSWNTEWSDCIVNSDSWNSNGTISCTQYLEITPTISTWTSSIGCPTEAVKPDTQTNVVTLSIGSRPSSECSNIIADNYSTCEVDFNIIAGTINDGKNIVGLGEDYFSISNIENGTEVKADNSLSYSESNSALNFSAVEGEITGSGSSYSIRISNIKSRAPFSASNGEISFDIDRASNYDIKGQCNDSTLPSSHAVILNPYFTQTVDYTNGSKTPSTKDYSFASDLTNFGECSFKCDAGYHYESSTNKCISNYQELTGNCSGIPSDTAYNSVDEIEQTQTWNGFGWNVPTPSLESVYNVESSNAACRYRCGGGLVWNGSSCENTTPVTCKTLYEDGNTTDGIYSIQPDITKPAFDAYCDMTKDGGGWTLVIRGEGASHVGEYSGNDGEMVSYNQTDPSGDTFKFSDETINTIKTETYRVEADTWKTCTKFYSGDCEYSSVDNLVSGSACMSSYDDADLTTGNQVGTFTSRSGLGDRYSHAQLSIAPATYPQSGTWGWYMEKECPSNTGYLRKCFGTETDCNFTLWVK